MTVETPIALLRDICTFDSGGTPDRANPEFYDGSTPWISGADIAPNGSISPRSHITELALSRSAARVVDSGTILLVTRTSVGKVTVAPYPVSFSQDITAIAPSPETLDTNYLVEFLRSQQHYFSRNARGATIKGITRDVIRNLAIPLPPLPEQRWIAAILDKADHLRTQRREAVAHLNALTQSIFDEMFGDLDRNTKAWPSAQLEQLLVEGPQNGMYLPSNDYGSGTPIVRIDSFRNGVVDDLATLKRLRASDSDVRRYGLRTGDVLINRVNSIEHLGKAAVVPTLHEPTVFESNMMRCRFDSEQINNTFIRFALQSQQVKRQILRSAKRAVNQASINQTDVKNFMLPVPPLELQQTFARRVDGIERLKEQHRAQLAELDALFASLQHRAFTGKL